MSGRFSGKLKSIPLAGVTLTERAPSFDANRTHHDNVSGLVDQSSIANSARGPAWNARNSGSSYRLAAGIMAVNTRPCTSTINEFNVVIVELSFRVNITLDLTRILSQRHEYVSNKVIRFCYESTGVWSSSRAVQAVLFMFQTSDPALL